jgi:hypothetical protein
MSAYRSKRAGTVDEETTTRRRRARDDRGVVLVLVAGAAVALLLMTALAIDGGQAYANRRQVQNGADAAAMAGTRELARVRFTPPTTVSGVVSEVLDVVDKNIPDLQGGDVSCWFVTSTLTRTSGDVCQAPSTSWNSATNGALGVEVSARGVKQTYFAQIAGHETVEARTDAAATIQPLIATAGKSPFILCGIFASNGFDVLDPNTLLVKPSAIGPRYPLQDPGPGNNTTFKRCDAQSNTFKGKSDGSPIRLGDWTGVDTGNGPPLPLDEDSTQVLGPDACELNTTTYPDTGCLMVIPIASNADDQGGSNTDVYIVQFAVFRVWGKATGQRPPECDNMIVSLPNTRYCGEITTAQVGEGETGTGPVEQGQAYAIKLVK